MRRLGALSRGGVTSVPGFRSWEYLRASLLWRRSPRSWTPTQPSTSQLYLYLCFFFFVFLFFFFFFFFFVLVVGEKQTRLDLSKSIVEFHPKWSKMFVVQEKREDLTDVWASIRRFSQEIFFLKEKKLDWTIWKILWLWFCRFWDSNNNLLPVLKNFVVS